MRLFGVGGSLAVAAAMLAILTNSATAQPRAMNGCRLGAPVNHTIIRLVGVGGYKGRWVATIYPMRHASCLPVLPFTHARSLSCTADHATGVVPVVVSIFNDTSGYPVSIQYSPGAYNSNTVFGAPAFEVDSGGSCWISPLTLTWRATSPGSSANTAFFLVAPDYFAPNAPHGNVSALRHTCLTGQISFGDNPMQRTGNSPSLGRRGLVDCYH